MAITDILPEGEAPNGVDGKISRKMIFSGIPPKAGQWLERFSIPAYARNNGFLGSE
jgi:hypothetical protein